MLKEDEASQQLPGPNHQLRWGQCWKATQMTNLRIAHSVEEVHLKRIQKLISQISSRREISIVYYPTAWWRCANSSAQANLVLLDGASYNTGLRKDYDKIVRTPNGQERMRMAVICLDFLYIVKKKKGWDWLLLKIIGNFRTFWSQVNLKSVMKNWHSVESNVRSIMNFVEWLTKFNRWKVRRKWKTWKQWKRRGYKNREELLGGPKCWKRNLACNTKRRESTWKANNRETTSKWSRGDYKIYNSNPETNQCIRFQWLEVQLGKIKVHYPKVDWQSVNPWRSGLHPASLERHVGGIALKIFQLF